MKFRSTINEFDSCIIQPLKKAIKSKKKQNKKKKTDFY